MAALLSFEMHGQDTVTKGMAALIAGTKNLTPFWRTVWAPKYLGIVSDLFNTGGRARGGGGKFKGGAWAGLSPAYRIWKKKHYPGRPILVREGKLFRSLRWEGGEIGPDGIFIAKPTHAIVSTRVPYAKYHQYGTKHMKARPFLPDPDPKVFAPLMQQWLVKQYTTQGQGS